MPFSDFCAHIPALQKKYPGIRFTDGWVFGVMDNIFPGDANDTGRIDTNVPGGDSSYHYTSMRHDSVVHLTSRGFYVDPSTPTDNDPPKFTFLTPAEATPEFSTIGEVARHLQKRKGDVLVDADEYNGYTGGGDQALRLRMSGGKVHFAHVNHYLDAEDEPQTAPGNQPVRVEKGVISFQEVPSEYGGGGGTDYRLLQSPPNVWVGIVPGIKPQTEPEEAQPKAMEF